MNLDDLLNEMSEKIRNRDLSDEYLREHNNSTREEIGIGEYAYGITMIPCEWVYEYLSDYKRVLKENKEYKKAIDVVNKEKADWIKAYQEEKDKQFDLINKISSNDFIQKQKVKDRIEELKNNPLKIKQNDKYYYETDAYNKIVIQVLQELLEGRK